MKKYHIVLDLLFGMVVFLPCIEAQIPHLERQVISIGGSCRSNDLIELCDNAGEIAVTTFLSPQVSLYQGFEQGNTSIIISTHEEQTISHLKISPNPAQDRITIRSDDFGIHLHGIAIYNVMGHRIPNIPVKEKSTVEIEIEVNALPSGVYLVSCPSQTNKLIIQKFIKI